MRADTNRSRLTFNSQGHSRTDAVGGWGALDKNKKRNEEEGGSSVISYHFIFESQQPLNRVIKYKPYCPSILMK